MCSRARGYFFEPRALRSLFRLFFSPAEFLPAVTNLSSSTITGPNKVAYPMLKHLCISFLPCGRHLLLFPSQVGKVSRLSCFLPAYLPHFLRLKTFRTHFSIASIRFGFLTPFSLPARPVSVLDDLLLIKFCSFLSPFRMDLTNPDRCYYGLFQSFRLCLAPRSFPQTYFGWPPFFPTFRRLRRADSMYVYHCKLTFEPDFLL